MKYALCLSVALFGLSMTGGCQTDEQRACDYEHKLDPGSGPDPTAGSPGTGTNVPMSNTPGTSGTSSGNSIR